MGEVHQASQLLHGLLINEDYEAALQQMQDDPSLIDSPLDHSGRLPFHYMVGGPDRLRRFLALGADPNQRDADGRTPLFAAGSRESVELLIASGARVDATDKDGRTVLFGCSENVRDLFLDNGASINGQDESGRSPAHSPALTPDQLNALVARGASLMIADRHGATPLHTCRAAAMLASHPADVDWNVVDSNGDTPLHYAVRAADSYWIHKLRELGADDQPNNDGDLPLDGTVGQLVVGDRLPAPVAHAVLSAQLFQDQIVWEFESTGFGVTEVNGPVVDPAPFDVVDFRLYSERLHALSGKPFRDWPELFDEPVVVDAGDEKNAALYRREHEPVDNSTIVASDFTPTSCRFEWSGQRQHFSDFHLTCDVQFRGIAVHAYSDFGSQANSSPEAFRAALLPHLVEFDERYAIVPVDEHRSRFRALPIAAANGHR